MSGPAHVVMVVGNDVTTDTRVRRMALSLARVGVRVTVLAYTVGGTRRETELGDVRIVRVPVPWRLRDARRARMTARRRGRVRIGYPSRVEARLARDRLVVRQREVNAELGLLRSPLSPRALVLRLRQVVLLGRRQVVTARGRAQGLLNTRRKRFWEKHDLKHSRRTRGAHWRRLLPDIDDYAIALGPVLDELRPDAIHAHDVHMVGIAAVASARAAKAGRRVPWVYDAHEYVAGLSEYGGRTKRVIAAYLDLEAEYVRRADRVMTVSPQLAEELERRYRLPRRPDVVMNVPVPDALERPSATTIRTAAGVAEGVPLMVYSGGVTSARGVQTAVEALPQLPDVHLAVVAVPHTQTHACRELTKAAEALGVADRLHLLDPVPPHEVVSFLSSADVGLIPLLHFGSHEVALTNKLFEYGHAGLPVVVSDCRAQREFVEQHGVGLVHAAGDAEGLARAVREVLADPERFRAAREASAEQLSAYTWEAQEETLWSVYRDLLPAGAVATTPRAAAPDDRETPVGGSTRRTSGPLLAIGPSNMAGQGWDWAKAVERSYPEVQTWVLALDNGKLHFPCDERVDPEAFRTDRAWAATVEARALSDWTHVLLEAGRPVLGTLHGSTFVGDARVLRASGVSVGLVFHGSEIRDPARHAATYAHSPFADPAAPLTERLQRQTDALAALVRQFDGPTFVSTPDLLDDVPGASWLPVVVDTSVWTPQPPPLEAAVPRLLHVPSNSALKGTAKLEAALRPLVDRGLVDYRRLEGVAPADMPSVLAEADIVLDHFVIGNYGVLACQALAQGRLVISHVDARVRDRVPRPVPILEATPETVCEVVEGVLRDRAAARALAAEGPDFVRELHDGRYSARVLAPFLGLA